MPSNTDPKFVKRRIAQKEHQDILNEAWQIMKQRTQAYGLSFKQYGALANLLNAARKVDRLMEVWWRGEDDAVAMLDKDLLDDAFDGINYLAFFIQEAREGNLLGDRPEYAHIQKSMCGLCSNPIWFQESPTGGWWIHVAHPLDGHDAVPIGDLADGC
jgi:hypothetical protein